jgi:hypothetical protein
VEDGIVLDTGRLCSIRLNDNNSVTVGAGTKWSLYLSSQTKTQKHLNILPVTFEKKKKPDFCAQIVGLVEGSL